MIMHGARCFLANRQGVAALEFAIIMPLFLLMLLGIFAYGIYFGAVHSTAQLAADAARTSVAGLSDAERSAIALQHVDVTASSYALLKREAITASAGPLEEDGTVFQVTITYDARNLPIWGFSPFLMLPSQKIVRTAVVKRGGY